jgi:hypothetical protein
MTSFNSCVKDVTKLKVVYQNDFETYQMDSIQVSGWFNGNFGGVSDIKIIDFNGNKVLGRFNNNLISLTLNNLPKHTAISVQFDLYLHDKWKNDLWKMTFDNSDYIITGFSNDTTIQQAYPNWLNGGGSLSPALSNAFTINLPGACRLTSSSHGSSMYKMVRTILHSSDTFQFSCSDAVHPFNDACEISWSMDNLKITTISN